MYLKFGSSEAAAAAQRALNGRFFAGKKIAADFQFAHAYQQVSDCQDWCRWSQLWTECVPYFPAPFSFSKSECNKANSVAGRTDIARSSVMLSCFV